MLRLLFIGLVIFMVIMVLRRILAQSSSPGPASARLESSAMVKCSHCQLHVPESEAIKSDEHFFCSAEHKLLEEQNAQ